MELIYPMDTVISMLQSVILAVVQGLGEFLPISSSGHILLAEKLFDIQANGAAQEAFLSLFTVFLHIGTLFAVLIVYWKDWWHILCGFWKSKTLLMLIIASLPALILKLLLKKVQLGGMPADDLLDSGFFLGFFFIFTALLLCFTEMISCRHRKGAEKDISCKHAVAMGCMQAVGMFGGISRSGSTIFGGVAAGASKEKAAKFSFMMSVPAILGGLLLDGKDFLDAVKKANLEAGLTESMAEPLSAIGMLKENITVIAVGMLVAGIVGYIAIRVFLKVISRDSFKWFAIYLLLLGIAVIAMQIAGVISLPPPAVPVS